MGSDRDLEARMRIVAHRVEFVELLEEEGPLAPRDVVGALPYSRPTVTRALRELREAGLAEKREEGYVPTLAGVMAAREYRRYETASRAVLSTGDLLAPIPESHAPPVDLLVGANAILADADAPVRALEVVSDLVRRAETVRAYLPTLVNTHLLRVWHRAVVSADVDSDAVFDPDLLTVLKGQYPNLLAGMAAAPGFSAFSATGPPYGVVLATTGDAATVAVVVYENDIAVRGVLVNDSAAAVEWGRAELDRLRAEGTAATADLRALGPAASDGAARPRPGGPDADRPRPGGPDADRPRPAGNAPTRSADGDDLPIDLETEGFVRLSGEYFDANAPAAPNVSWRTGFTLAEVRAGHAVDRLDAEGRNLTRRLVDGTRDGTDHVVLGPPGSGKSTVCMAVACEWYDRGLGPVLYRERGRGDRFGSTSQLEAYLRQADGHALVVVEDAVRDEASAVFEVMRALDADPGVAFLLDARTHEWHDPDAFDAAARRDAYRRSVVESVAVPGLDEHECGRFVAHFADLVGADLDLSGADLFAMVEDGTTAGEDSLPAGDALVAQHYLVRRHDPLFDVEGSAATALDDAVRHTYRRLADDGSRFAPDLAVMVSLLAAAGVPVASEYLYAVAEPDEYAAVDEAVSLLRGRLLFEQDTLGPRSTATYRTRHETWAVRFLDGVRALDPEERARERFGRCVTRLLALADDPARRERIRRHLGGRTPHLHRIEADPRGWADEVTERVFGVGRANAGLAPLFGETTDDAIELPGACSARTRLRQAYWRGEMNRTHGDLDRAEREYRTLGDLAGAVGKPAASADAGDRGNGDDAETCRARWRATSRIDLGTVARDRGEYGTAEKRYREAFALFREIGDPEGTAISLKNLGAVAYLKSEYDRARDYLERSLDAVRDLDAPAIEARCLNNLGTVAQDRDEYGRAREYYERSLEIKRDLGDRKGEATSLNNLGRIARRRGEYDLAAEYHERSLEIRRDLGDSRGEAHSLNDLGAVALCRGEHDSAREYLDRALEAFEAVGSESGAGRARLLTGRLALSRGETDRAREYADEARETFDRLETPYWVARSRRLLGRVAAAAGSPDEAREHWRAALETFASVDTPPDALVTLEALVETCDEDGDRELAREWCRRARDLLADAPAPTAALHRDSVERHAARLDES